ncbi:hypothetical protein L596_017672 [Steinernema carpocapsae]|uniref:Uncharacterized protein n=1 Tax=Steinernema carpocapsae TaxID=34508 RepID=A0A4U5N2L9_STECR|nr:hypothetical protein L596_017672 [Steinernema carpocapsae]
MSPFWDWLLSGTASSVSSRSLSSPHFLEGIMEDREDRLFEAFPKDGDAAEFSDEDEDSEDDTVSWSSSTITASRCIYQIVEKWFGRKHNLATIRKKISLFSSSSRNEAN